MESKEDQAYIREVARLYFQNLPKETRFEVEFFFRGLDVDGDRTLSLPEILESPLSTKFGPGFAPHAAQLFSFLDFDGNNSLDFHEFITLVFLYTVKAPTCHHCSCLLIRPPYTCLTCLHHQTDPYYLCLPCYSSKAFHHAHPDLVLAYGLEHTFVNTPNEVQCMVCGDHHSTKAKSCMDDEGKHIQMVESHGYICEYCMNINCSNCRKFILGLVEEAKPSHCVETGNVCKDCEMVEPSAIDLDNLYQSMIDEDQEMLQTCNTCRIKVKNCTLLQVKNRESATDETKSATEETESDTEETESAIDQVSANIELMNLMNVNMHLQMWQLNMHRINMRSMDMWRNWNI